MTKLDRVYPIVIIFVVMAAFKFGVTDPLRDQYGYPASAAFWLNILFGVFLGFVLKFVI